jgi:hypothetical protein
VRRLLAGWLKGTLHAEVHVRFLRSGPWHVVGPVFLIWWACFSCVGANVCQGRRIKGSMILLQLIVLAQNATAREKEGRQVD